MPLSSPWKIEFPVLFDGPGLLLSGQSFVDPRSAETLSASPAARHTDGGGDGDGGDGGVRHTDGGGDGDGGDGGVHGPPGSWD
jgi:hypothetical protein